jgi:hypothetical protein
VTSSLLDAVIATNPPAMSKRNSVASWNGASVQITSQIISRYAWTTATIDVSINGNTVLRTGGVMKTAGDTTVTFEYERTPHKAVLRWRNGSLRSFPFQLEIDGALVADSRAPVSNWWLAWWPLTATFLLALLWRMLTSS